MNLFVWVDNKKKATIHQNCNGDNVNDNVCDVVD